MFKETVNIVSLKIPVFFAQHMPERDRHHIYNHPFIHGLECRPLNLILKPVFLVQTLKAESQNFLDPVLAIPEP